MNYNKPPRLKLKFNWMNEWYKALEVPIIKAGYYVNSLPGVSFLTLHTLESLPFSFPLSQP